MNLRNAQGFLSDKSASPLASMTRFCCRVMAMMCLATMAWAEPKLFTEFGDLKIYHSVFNSSFLTPEVAKQYDLTRSGNEALLNVAVVREGDQSDIYGQKATVTGFVKNLMQQKRTLEFQEVQEQKAVYYLASLSLETGDEPIHFTLNVDVDGESYEVTFTRKLYRD